MIVKHTSLKFRIFKDYFFKIIVILLAILLVLPLFVILGFVFKNGLSVISFDFLTQIPNIDIEKVSGGVANAIIGSILIVFLASVMSIPFGIIVGIYLAENVNKVFANFLRLAVEILQGTPSIVIGIIAYGILVVPFGKFSALAGGFALGIMMLPVIIRSTEENIILVPDFLREAGYALGLPYYKIILKIVLPTCMSGVLTSILIAIARAFGETAPLLFTAFGNPFINVNIFKPTASLPALIYGYATSPYEVFHSIAWGAASVLIIFILFLNLLAKLLDKKLSVKI